MTRGGITTPCSNAGSANSMHVHWNTLSTKQCRCIRWNWSPKSWCCPFTSNSGNNRKLLPSTTADYAFLHEFLCAKLGSRYLQHNSRANGKRILIVNTAASDAQVESLLLANVLSQHGYQVSLLGTHTTLDHLPLIMERAPFDALLLPKSSHISTSLQTLVAMTRITVFLSGFQDEWTSEPPENLPIYWLPEELGEICQTIDQVLSEEIPMTTAIVWLRQDLRLADNPALYHACQSCDNVIPVFIDDPLPTSVSQLGAASRVWLHHSLQALDDSLQAAGNRLTLRQGAALPVLQALIAASGATHVYWNRVYDPASLARDKHIKETLKQTCEVHSFNASLLNEPWEVLKADGTPYKVFTPYWKAMLKHGIQHLPLPIPARIPAAAPVPETLPLAALGLLPSIRWDTGMMAHWQVGETAAMQKLHDFLPSGGADYQEARNIPAQAGTARLSPHLHFGEISPRQAVYHTENYLAGHPGAESGLRHFMQEIGWREFAYYLLYHFPQTRGAGTGCAFRAFPVGRASCGGVGTLATWANRLSDH